MIEAAVVLSALAQHWPDFGIILVLLLANAVVGFWEEHQAGNAIAALKAKLAVEARVRRDGKWVTPPARELVPGDVIRVRLGDIVPADARLHEGDSIEVDQSALTGESLPATRKSGEAVFSGSIVRQGEIGALVYATGANTYFGKTAELVQEAHTVSHFQRAVLKIGDYLIVLALALVALIVVVSVIRGDPILTTLQFALVLTVAAIPVAMPTVLSVTMAVGARLLAKREAIVTRLAAIEELAGVDVLCADKTGTLTQNKLTLGDPFGVSGVDADEVIRCAALASREEDKDTIDMAVLDGLKDAKALKGYKVTHFQPFDPVHKRTEATVKGPDGKTFQVAKGAPQVILEMSANAGKVKAAVDKAVNEFAARGFRSLGVARADGKGKWQFLGVLPLFDPPRAEAKATIATARQMGVTIKMVTGDALAIAVETAKKLGMGTNILDASGFGDTEHKATAKLAGSIESADGFAQVFPEHKFHIVEVLQKRGHIVGMTGDGVNDAPALKKADCGIAVSGATDAARAAASIVLLTSGLSVIIEAIKESRKIFQRMNSYAMYRIAETLRVLLFMTLAILVFNFYPVTAVMIVMLALLNDGAILSIAYDNVHYKDQPEAWNMRVVLGIATVLGDHRGRLRLRPVLSGRASLQSRPEPHPDADVSEAVRGRAPDDLPDTHSRSVLDHSPRAGLAVGGVRHSSRGDVDSRLWAVHDAPRLGLGSVRLGLRAGVVPRERPGQSARLSAPRSCQSRSAGRFGATQGAASVVGQRRLADRRNPEPRAGPFQPINAASGFASLPAGSKRRRGAGSPEAV